MGTTTAATMVGLKAENWVPTMAASRVERMAGW